MAEFKDYDVPADWRPIVERTVEAIEKCGATIFQVKSKFGGLRIYIADYGDDTNQAYVDQLIDAAEFYVSRLPDASGI